MASGAGNCGSPDSTPLESSPYFACRLNHQSQLRHLLFFGQRIAFMRRREAALWGKANLVQRYVFCCLIDTAFQRVFALERGTFAGD